MQRIGAILVGLFLLAFATIMGVAVFTYNPMVKLSQAVDAQWAQVQNVYQRRADLIPNLVKTVEGAADFEKTTITEVTQARASVGQVKIDPNQAPYDPQQFAAFQKAQDGLSSALSRLLVVAEKYPDLKATENFRDLQAQIEGSENRIAVERARFNATVMLYNTKIATFPNVLVARFFHFLPRPYFTASEGSEKPPAVNFDFGGRKIDLGGKK
jgi:LemA protein